MYDLAIIGGGPAGYSAALEGVRLGLRMILFEKDQLGGTCLNRGCVPTKFLSHVAKIRTEMDIAIENGISFTETQIDFYKTMARKAEIISSLRNGLTQQMLQKKIKVIQGTASIKEKNRISCNGTDFETKNILIATGAVPIKPFISKAISSDKLLELDEIPRNLHILGGGPVAVEFASIFCALGSDVTISIRGERILQKWDKEIAVNLTQSMKQKGIRIQTKTNFETLQIENDAVILSAMGRIPNLEGLNNTYFDIGPHNGIITDTFGRTKVSGIFAAGDVVDGSHQLAHIGMEQGRQVARWIAGVAVTKPSAIVKTIIASQEIASVGLTEQEAKNKGIRVITAKQNLYSNARTMIVTKERGFIKVVADLETKKIIGAQLICERAGDIVAELALAINHNLSLEDMLVSIRPHPSYCEAITDVMMLLLEKMR
ncbi:MAG: NAD(P)/FAD-dependent oxidoreductase [Lachnospiraceae bacterium]|nr:NAD(P)/FAD-dependent oxidoreductase [Lachnospiraceae bacterium]RKJ54137.1 NAD(P)/FAD-dependent oxidoreductase [bacterium 1XD42-8]RKJ64590.1 NAD(P)/FAD-dependent oxidoreductase [bacterium 1XD42-1]